MTAPAAHQHQIVTFRLGDDHFAADIFAVERVLRWQPLTPVPKMPGWVEGMIEYQGRVVPVLDLRRRFGLDASEPRPETRILVIATGGEWIGAIVDAVLEVIRVPAGQLSAPPALFRGLSAEYIRGIVRRGERLIIFLDAPRLLSATERVELQRATVEV
jgi:purine-binding chemotaxis protein CheW